MLESVLILPLIGILALLIIPRDDILCLWKTGLEWSLLTLTGAILL